MKRHSNIIFHFYSKLDDETFFGNFIEELEWCEQNLEQKKSINKLPINFESAHTVIP